MSFWKWSRSASSNANADSSINWAEGMAPSAVNDSARAMMAAAAKFRDDISGSLATGGTSTAYTVSSNQTFDTLAHLDKAILTIVPHADSGAAPSLNVDGLGAKAINVISGVPVVTGALKAGTPYPVIYFNATTEFILINPFTAALLTAGIITTTMLGAAQVTYAKIQNVTNARLLGNNSGGAAAPSEISLGTGLVFSGSTLKTGGTPTVQIFTSGSAQTYSTPAGATWLKVREVGGGGGTSGTGGTTSFNSVTAVGGSPGTAHSGNIAGIGGAGGTGGVGTATLRLPGAAGSDGGVGTGAGSGIGGMGGTSVFGGAGTPSGKAATANSGSGSGGVSFQAAGGDGGGGAGEYVELIISAPSATYTYTVGAAGSGGGAAGRIIVEEYYN
jgi:hypothetical protein